MASDDPRRLLRAAGLADRPREAGRPLPAARARDASCGASRRSSSSRRRTTRRCSRSATRSAPGSTSSPTARCAARATPTASPPRSTASTSTTPAPRSTAAAIRTRCRASSARSAASTRSRSRDVEFLRAQHRPHDQDHGARPVHDVAAGAERLLRRATRSSALDYAAAVNEEIKDLFAAGADIVQIDEPYMQARPEKAREYGLEGARTARSTASTGTTAVHICFGYAAIIHERPEGYSFLPELAGARVRPDLDRDRAVEPRLRRCSRRCRARRSSSACSTSSTTTVETPETSSPSASAARSPHVPAERIVVAPDCGMKYLPRDRAFGKMEAMVEGARRRCRVLGDEPDRGHRARRHGREPGPQHRPPRRPDRRPQPHGVRRRRSSWRSSATKGRSPPAESLEEFVAALERPRRIIVMVKAGAPVDGVIDELAPLLDEGDIVIDAGNSHFPDTRRRDAGVRASAGCASSARASPAARRARCSARASCPAATARRLRRGRGGLHHDRRAGRRRAVLRLHRPRRRRPLREDGPQRHRVRRHAADRRGLRPPAPRRRPRRARRSPASSTSGTRATSSPS